MYGLRSLRKGLEHVADLVRGQQQFAQPGGIACDIEPTTLLEEALVLVEQNLGRDDQLEVTRSFDQDLGALRGDRHRTLDILINLIQNARQAMNGQEAPRRLVLLTGQDEEGPYLEVGDSGMGISQVNLARVFSPGFTTRRDGHGFGLHTAANAAREMGGHLAAHSPGPHQGATFRLRLPAFADLTASN